LFHAAHSTIVRIGFKNHPARDFFVKKFLARTGDLTQFPRVARQGGPTEMPPGLLGFPRGMIGRAASFLSVLSFGFFPRLPNNGVFSDFETPAGPVEFAYEIDPIW
jgi:hypothetical protein